MTRRWIIRGYDGLTEMFESIVSGNMATEASISRILQALAARHLSETETVDALGPSEQDNRLAVRRDLGTPRVSLSCGQNPYYTALLEQPD